MLEFLCYNCGVPVAASEAARGTTVVCYNCNTRQPVPENAVKVNEVSTESDPAPPRAPVPRRKWLPAETPPAYSGLDTVGGILLVIGGVQCVAAVVLACVISPLMLTAIVSGVVTIGLGLALQCLRNVAIDVWHIRRRS